MTNQRTDRYGAETDGRLQLHLEIIHAIRESLGNNYPIAVRLGGCNYMEGGSTIQDCVLASKQLEQAGIDLLDIYGGFCGYIRPGAAEQGYFSEMTQAVKKAVLSM